MKGEALKLFRGARKGRSIVEEEETQQTFFFHSQLFFLFLASSALLERARKREREREPHGSSTAKLSRDVLLPAALPKPWTVGAAAAPGATCVCFFFHFFLGTVERIRSPFCLSPPHLSLTCNFPPLPISFNHSLAPPAPRRRLPRSAARSRTRSRCGREKEKERKKTSFFLLLHCRRRRRPFFFFFGLQRRTNGRA